MSPELVQIGTTLLTIGVLYGTMKTESRNTQESIKTLSTQITQAHDRISDHIQDHARGTYK
jgi:hypothetical protein